MFFIHNLKRSRINYHLVKYFLTEEKLQVGDALWGQSGVTGKVAQILKYLTCIAENVIEPTDNVQISRVSLFMSCTMPKDFQQSSGYFWQLLNASIVYIIPSMICPIRKPNHNSFNLVVKQSDWLWMRLIIPLAQKIGLSWEGFFSESGVILMIFQVLWNLQVIMAGI